MPYDDITDLILADRYPGNDRNANYWAIQRAATGGAAPPDRVVQDVPPSYSGPGPSSGVLYGTRPNVGYQPNPYPHGPTLYEERVDPSGNYADRPANPIITDRPPTGRPSYMRYRDEEFSGRGPALEQPDYQGAQVQPSRTYGFRGAMGGAGAVGDDEYPVREPVPRLPYAPYANMQAQNPGLFEAVTTVAKDMRMSPVTLAQLVRANSDGDPRAENGHKVGWMGLTPDDARQYDPEGHLDINDPVHNLYLGAIKYQRAAQRFGANTPESFAAYYAGGDAVETALGRHGDQHKTSTPPGTFAFVNKVLGRDEHPPVRIEPLSGNAREAGASERVLAGSGGQPGREALRRVLPPPAGPDETMQTPDQEPIQPRSETMQTPDQEPMLRRIPDDPLSPPTLPYAPESGDYGGGGAPARRRPAAPASRADVSADELNRQERMRLTAPGVTDPGNIDLGLRPRVRNPDGSLSTVRSMSFNENGREVLIPTVAEDGSRILSEQEAIDQYRRTGRHLGKFDTPQNATAYAEDLHRSQERTYAGRQQPGPGTQTVAMAPTGTQVAALAPPGAPPAAVAAAPAPAPQAALVAPGRLVDSPSQTVPGPQDRAIAERLRGQGQPTQAGGEVAVGDSIAAHLIRKAGVGGAEDRTRVGSYRPGDTAVSGWGPQQILDQVIPGIPADQIQGKNVLLSTGLSNNPQQIDAVAKQIAALKARGAANVTLLGVGTDPKLAGVNDRLAQIAQENGVTFAGPMGKVAKDGIHSADPQDLLRQARAVGGDRVRIEPLASQAAPAGGGATPGSGAPSSPAATAAANAQARAITAPGGPDSPAGRARGMVPAEGAGAGVGVGGVQLPPEAVDRFTSNPGTMTPQGLVRSAQGGPGNVMTYISRNAGRGLNNTDAWNQALDKLTRAAMLQEGMDGAKKAFAYVTLMQHRGAMQNLMQAASMLRDDPEGAARALAMSHAFAPDGSEIHLRVQDGKVYGARFNEQTHEQIGQPFLVTEQGVRRQIQALSDPTKFAETVHNEYTANLTEANNAEHARHNRVSETQQAETHRQTALDREEARKLREAQFQQEQARRDAESKRHAEEFKVQQDRLREDALRREADFKQNQARLQHDKEIQEAKDKAAAEQRAWEKEQDRQVKEAQQAQQAAEKERVAQAATAKHRATVSEEADALYDPNGNIPARDINGYRYKGEDLDRARQLYVGIGWGNEHIQGPTRENIVKNIMAKNYDVHAVEDPNYTGRDRYRFYVVNPKTGNVVAAVPQHLWSAYYATTEPAPDQRPKPKSPRERRGEGPGQGASP